MPTKLVLEKETYKIIGACINVHKKLGNGFLEPVYQEVLVNELLKAGIPFEQQKKLTIYYDGSKLNNHFVADFVCFKKIMVEIKSVNSMNQVIKQQVINYLKATNLQIGLLINFGEKSLTWKRFINTHNTSKTL